MHTVCGAKAAAWTVSVQVPSVLPRCLAQVDVSRISYMTTLLFLVLDEKTTHLESTHKLSTAMKRPGAILAASSASESYADGLIPKLVIVATGIYSQSSGCTPHNS